MHFSIALLVFFFLVTSQCVMPPGDYMSDRPNLCTKKEIERLMSGNASIVYDQLENVFDENAVFKFLNHTHSKTEIADALKKANFRSFASIVDRPILYEGDKCWLDFLGFATMKDSNCVLGGRKSVILTIKNEKISRWEEVFFPLNFTQICTERDYAKLPQSHFGSLQDTKASSDEIQLSERERSGARDEQDKPAVTRERIERPERPLMPERPERPLKPLKPLRPVTETAGEDNNTSESGQSSRKSSQSQRSYAKNTTSGYDKEAAKKDYSEVSDNDRAVETAGENQTSEKGHSSRSSEQSQRSYAKNTTSGDDKEAANKDQEVETAGEDKSTSERGQSSRSSQQSQRSYAKNTTSGDENEATKKDKEVETATGDDKTSESGQSSRKSSQSQRSYTKNGTSIATGKEDEKEGGEKEDRIGGPSIRSTHN